MKPIVIFSLSEDFHTDSVIREIHDIGGSVLRLNRDELGVKWTGTWSIKGNKVNGYLDYDGVSHRFKDLGAVYLRRPVTVETSNADHAGDSDATELYVATQNSIHINSLLRLLEKTNPAMNTTEANMLASSKVVQLSEAEKAGLQIPCSCAAGAANHVENFLLDKKPSGKLCMKAIEAIHLREPDGKVYAHYTNLVEQLTPDEVYSLKKCPIILQEYIDKEIEVRATVVGDKIFAASIDTSNANAKAKVDWRHYDWAQTPYYQYALPKQIQDNIIQLMRNLGLTFGAIDLIKTPDGQYYFLEVNAQGQWLWIEDLTGLPISSHIAKWLVERST